MQYNYELALQDVKEHIDGFRTRNYYSSKGGAEVIDLLRTEHLLEGFCIGNIIKYAQRYGKKNGYNMEDLKKIIHYAIIMMCLHDKRNEEFQSIINE